MNAGERDELIIKLYLLFLKKQNTVLNGEVIKSVGFGEEEYKAVVIKNPNTLLSLPDNDLLKLAQKAGITKTSARSKSDVYINNIGYSLKSQSAAPPALVNHTTRPGFERVCSKTGIDISELGGTFKMRNQLPEMNKYTL